MYHLIALSIPVETKLVDGAKGWRRHWGGILEEFIHRATKDVAFPSVKSSLRARIFFQAREMLLADVLSSCSARWMSILNLENSK
jgi:hypothetical protein